MDLKRTLADLSQERVVVVGLGKSGAAAAGFCARHGASVVATDDQPEERLGPALEKLAGLPVRLELGGLRAETLRGATLVVLSPGVPPTLPAIQAARQAGVPITGEIELASRFIQAPIVGITGTNGKSTVTSLCGAIALQTGRPTFCGGNLGDPLITALDTPAAGPSGIVLCELSSFQLETADTLRCHAAAVLNLTPDHLDRYPSMDAYGDAKARIARNMAPLDTLVLNADDPPTLALIERNYGMGRPAYLFSVRGLPPAQPFMERSLRVGGYVDYRRRAASSESDVDGGELVLLGAEGGLRALVHAHAGSATQEERYPIDELHLVGRHNLANALAAYLLMRASGLASYEQVREAARRFRPLPHRMELVAERGGVRYYDDSKGTNVDAVVAGLDGFPRPFALIAGGRHKGGSYAPLARVLAENRVRGVVVIGEAAPLIAQALQGVTRVVPAASMAEAVDRAAALCRGGDAVVLSPACSSFDMFRDYAHRAEVFRAAVELLPGQGGPP